MKEIIYGILAIVDISIAIGILVAIARSLALTYIEWHNGRK